jgi:AcrR family transcriptional regulator
MVLKAPPHKQERAISTRRQLIAAAREIFVKEGFESARIEQIAARAGKTRGAFYANFTDKEDVFFAIFEEDMMRDREKVNAALSAASSQDQKIDTLARHLSELLDDSQRFLLNLEFKMYGDVRPLFDGKDQHPAAGPHRRRYGETACDDDRGGRCDRRNRPQLDVYPRQHFTRAPNRTAEARRTRGSPRR